MWNKDVEFGMKFRLYMRKLWWMMLFEGHKEEIQGNVDTDDERTMTRKKSGHKTCHGKESSMAKSKIGKYSKYKGLAICGRSCITLPKF